MVTTPLPYPRVIETFYPRATNRLFGAASNFQEKIYDFLRTIMTLYAYIARRNVSWPTCWKIRSHV